MSSKLLKAAAALLTLFSVCEFRAEGRAVEPIGTTSAYVAPLHVSSRPRGTASSRYHPRGSVARPLSPSDGDDGAGAARRHVRHGVVSVLAVLAAGGGLALPAGASAVAEAPPAVISPAPEGTGAVLTDDAALDAAPGAELVAPASVDGDAAAADDAGSTEKLGKLQRIIRELKEKEEARVAQENEVTAARKKGLSNVQVRSAGSKKARRIANTWIPGILLYMLLSSYAKGLTKKNFDLDRVSKNLVEVNKARDASRKKGKVQSDDDIKESLGNATDGDDGGGGEEGDAAPKKTVRSKADDDDDAPAAPKRTGWEGGKKKVVKKKKKVVKKPEGGGGGKPPS